MERARTRAGLPPFTDLLVQPLDRLRFEQGVPLMSEGALLQVPEALWKMAADRLIPALEQGFPNLGKEIAIIRQAFSAGSLNPERCVTILTRDPGGEAEAAAADLGVGRLSMQFILGQIVKPLVEKKAEALSAIIAGLGWPKGYCPVCGSMPELAFIKGEEGRRWLRCALCSQCWRFDRLFCPFCENENQEELLVYCVAGREQERAEICEKCGRYVVCIDLRGQGDESVLEVAAIGMMHLDVLTQEKGLLPAAVCAWNAVRSEDISSSPIDSGSRRLDS